MVVEITAQQTLVFDFPECETFTISKGLTFHIKPRRTETFFFWKTANKRRVARRVPHSLKKIFEYINKQSA